ncbi:phospholipase D-like domain-containing protein [Psychroserpens mesophilus]|uniref:phospholipase D-like domain-containing protein n=1 Tax=Psychroserpens mesophilus TaxID=325473 RepID=UPI00058FD26A|nr:phospholipase D-like domain-containing protein [Psychroserpens mesophilus]
MAKTKLLSNNSKNNHLDYIIACFKEADEIWLATAFFKMSGLKLLLPAIKKYIEANKPINIIVGQNFGLTEPEALRIIFKLFEKKAHANLFLDKAQEKTNVFHPKLFLFKNNDKGIIISGSANITKGGLTTNQEVSLVSHTKSSSKDWKASIKYFKSITSKDNASLLNLMLINRYEDYYKKQLKARKNQKATPEKRDSEYSFDYKKLKKRLKKYRTTKSKADFKQREKDYKEAKKLLNEIADSNRLTQNRFEEIIDSLVGAAGQKAFWKSGSLYRNRRFVYNSKNEFRGLVQFIKEHQNNLPNDVFTEAKDLVENVHGARVNYITEIMMTFQPNHFANLNSNPITVLKKEAGVYFKAHSDSFSGQNYQDYCFLIEEIRNELDLKNMLEVDSFFNEIYWLLKQESKN